VGAQIAGSGRLVDRFDAVPGLDQGLCGDWLNGGKLEGAWLSGRALAQQVLQPFGSR
jgi:predicted NAD/FAD-dependent oxidoreductase